jgi:ferredoxin--NADP+ reductase
MTPEEIAEQRRKRYNATVVWVRKPHPELMVFRVRTDFPVPAHKPGQYTTLGLGNWEPRFPGCDEESLKPGEEEKLVRRAYSMSCSILDSGGELFDLPKTDWLEFYVVLLRKSDKPIPPALTPRLFLLKEGDRLLVGERPRITTCSGSCSAAGTTGELPRPAACAIAATWPIRTRMRN